MDNPLLIFLSRLNALEALWSTLEDRVAVMEDITVNHENRLQDIEELEDERQDEE